jgi:AcrR family transcriptional regulator
MIELSAERGYEQVTIRGITRLAGVSTRTFYKHFANTEECFLDTYEALMQSGRRRAYAAQAGIEDWEEAIRASLRALLEDFAADPPAARLALVEAFALGSSIQARMRDEIEGFEQLLIDSFAGAPPGVAPPREVVHGIAAGVMRVARRRLLGEEDTDIAALAAGLGDWVLSFPGRLAPALDPGEPSPFALLSGRNGDSAREDTAPMILGGPGDEEGRILSAAAKLAATVGYQALTIPMIRAEAGVSRRSFDARFGSVGECFLAAIEAITAVAVARAEGNARETSRWERAIDQEIEALCGEVARNPQLARLVLVEIFAPGREGLERRELMVSLAAHRLRHGALPTRRPSELAAEASVAAGWRIAHTELAVGRPDEVRRLAPTLTYMILAPVLGPVAAAEAIGAEARAPVR